MTINSRDLDNYITGHYGEDQWQGDPLDDDTRAELLKIVDRLETINKRLAESNERDEIENAIEALRNATASLPASNGE